jgi:hypothetical protein
MPRNFSGVGGRLLCSCTVEADAALALAAGEPSKDLAHGEDFVAL